MADAGADADGVRGDLDGVELVEAFDVDQRGGRGEPHVQQRHQALATGEDLAVVPSSASVARASSTVSGAW